MKQYNYTETTIISKNNLKWFYQSNGKVSPARLKKGIVPDNMEWCKSKLECLYATKNNLTGPEKCWCGNDRKMGLNMDGYITFCGHCKPVLLTKPVALQLLDKNNKFTGNKSVMSIPIVYEWCESFSDYVWCILKDISSPPKCKNKNCSNPTKRYGWEDYRPYCSTLCSHDPNNSKNRDNGFKMRKRAMEKSGRWINDLDRGDYDMYSTIIRRDSEKNVKTKYSDEDLSRRGKTENSLHLDHRYSIYEGFHKNIPVVWMSRACNLELINSHTNMSKGTNSSISMDELFTD